MSSNSVKIWEILRVPTKRHRSPSIRIPISKDRLPLILDSSHSAAHKTLAQLNSSTSIGQTQHTETKVEQSLLKYLAANDSGSTTILLQHRHLRSEAHRTATPMDTRGHRPSLFKCLGLMPSAPTISLDHSKIRAIFKRIHSTPTSSRIRSIDQHIHRIWISKVKITISSTDSQVLLLNSSKLTHLHTIVQTQAHRKHNSTHSAVITNLSPQTLSTSQDKIKFSSSPWDLRTLLIHSSHKEHRTLRTKTHRNHFSRLSRHLPAISNNRILKLTSDPLRLHKTSSSRPLGNSNKVLFRAFGQWIAIPTSSRTPFSKVLTLNNSNSGSSNNMVSTLIWQRLNSCLIMYRLNSKTYWIVKQDRIQIIRMPARSIRLPRYLIHLKITNMPTLVLWATQACLTKFLDRCNSNSKTSKFNTLWQILSSKSR